MTEQSIADATYVNDARCLKREYVVAHVSLVILLVLGSFAGWTGAEAIGVERTRGVLIGLALPIGIYFVYSLFYGFRVWVSMHACLEQLSHTTNAILSTQNERFTSLIERVNEKCSTPIPQHEANNEQESALVEKIERENADWLYDADGNTTKEAEAIRQHIEEARRLGIKGAQARWDYATAMLERDLLKAAMERNRKSAGGGPSAAPPSTSGTSIL